jgi:hypothetical protein
VSDPPTASRPRAVAPDAAPTGRGLTSAEARVIASLLAADAIPERDRIRASGLSPRTYETARRRIFAAGWVYERFVPDPIAWGRPTLHFELTRPEPGTEAEAAERLGASGSAFHVWRGPGLVFSASFCPETPGDEPPVRSRLSAARDASWQMDVDLRLPSVPIFFDLEGAWSRVLGVAPRVYPRPLPTWSGSRPPDQGRPPAALLREVELLIRRPFAPGGGASSGRHLGSWIGFGGGRRALATGLVQRRCFLDLTRISEFDGWRLQSLGFLFGNLRTGEHPETLFRELLSDAGMTPFLFATDGKSVLIGALSPAPRSARTPPRTRISEIFARRLETWTLASAPATSMTTRVDHRYDRLLPASSA